MFPRVTNPRQVKLIAAWMFGSAALNTFIGYQMWGERGVQNRVCSACFVPLIMHSSSWPL